MGSIPARTSIAEGARDLSQPDRVSGPLRAGFHPASFHHAYGGGFAHHGWVGHAVGSAIIHGLIYGAIFRLLRHLSLLEVVVLAIVAIWLVSAWNRSRRF